MNSLYNNWHQMGRVDGYPRIGHTHTPHTHKIAKTALVLFDWDISWGTLLAVFVRSLVRIALLGFER
jgi:hypothetical protein